MTKSHIFGLLKDQVDLIEQKHTIRLNGINNNSTSNLSSSEVVDGIYEFLHSFDPPLIVEKLSLEDNYFPELPSNFYKIASRLKYLDLHNNSIAYIPKDFFYKLASLEILDLSSNKLTYLPDSISILTNLKVISIKDNRFRYINPSLGELSNLNLIEVTNNPLILPSNEIIKTFQKQKSDLDWVHELKNYLVTNRVLIRMRIEDSMNKEARRPYEYPDLIGESIHGTSPPVRRSQSISEGTKIKSSKASRRMGLIIRKSDDLNNESANKHIRPSSIEEDINNNNNNNRSYNTVDYKSTPPSHPPPPPLSAPIVDHGFGNLSSPPRLVVQTTTETTSSSPSISHSPSSITSGLRSIPASTKSPSRSRSNTLKEIDRILEKSESVDTEHKSSAYFRRLSTLQEIPQDESDVGDDEQHHHPKNNMSQDGRLTLPSVPSNEISSKDTTPSSSSHVSRNPALSIITTTNDTGGSQLNKIALTQRKHSSITIVKVSRKILFSFSELHSSIRRFTGFSSDKKVTIKMVSFLYSTKSNIDTLVENLEIMEETGNNLDSIVTSLHTCITSFKAMMSLLSENFSSFVNKIDICFIRMLYLSMYGSFNELQNAFSLLVASTKSEPKFVYTPVVESKPKLPPIGVDHLEEVDEKLYVTIESATTNAQLIFNELNQAINKVVISSSPENQPQVANRVKELINVCAASLEITKRLQTKLYTIRNNPSQTTKKLFAEDINQFIKTMVQTLASVKAIVKDLPILDDIRGSMSNLTKTAKEVTYMLEVSSYKSLLPEASSSSSSSAPGGAAVQSAPAASSHVPPPLMSMPSASSFMSSGPAPMRTPLVATGSQISGGNIQEMFVAANSPVGSVANTPSPLAQTNMHKNGPNPFDNLTINRSSDINGSGSNGNNSEM
ncbi:SOG2 [[Candida] subhashii]|uniref:SOG2 n=1 Tax=[Candida] subhashii TaxID=561895 RepID=A0A8J5R562_9ASCO|nr:SOG2 [[Candida] subhashii]KAG7665455.1 SOG2 [[Candida] subhashii]